MQLLIRRYATLLLGCSEKACRYVFGDAAMRDARCHVLPDGINCDRFAFRAEVRSEMRAAYGLDGRFVVGHVGHFTAAKNHEKILRVFAALCRRRQDAALLLVGDGELEADVRRMAQELEIADRVVFAGECRMWSVPIRRWMCSCFRRVMRALAWRWLRHRRAGLPALLPTLCRRRRMLPAA